MFVIPIVIVSLLVIKMLKFILGGFLATAGVILGVLGFVTLGITGGAAWMAILWIAICLAMFLAGIYLMRMRK